VYEKLVVPLDGSKEGESVIPYVQELATKFKSQVILFNVIPSLHEFCALDGCASSSFSDEQMKSEKASAQKYLDRIAAGLKAKGLTVQSEVKLGEAAQEIIKYANQISANVVMSTHGHSGFNHMSFGSVTEKVLHGGKTPVTLVRVSETKK
jgi:nucleotide-binding universal stress UspA family protein